MISKNTCRDRKRGVVLISTLVSLVLVIGLSLVLQSIAINNALVSRKLVALHESEMAKDAAWAYARPYAAQVFTTGDPVNGQFEWRNFEVQVEAKTGASRHVATLHLRMSE